MTNEQLDKGTSLKMEIKSLQNLADGLIISKLKDGSAKIKVTLRFDSFPNFGFSYDIFDHIEGLSKKYEDKFTKELCDYISKKLNEKNKQFNKL